MTDQTRMSRPQAVLRKLDEIEGEMRAIGAWDDSLDVEDIRSRAIRIATEERRSPVGSMPFEHWLQAVFLPNAREAARTETLPSSSQVSIMGMREYDGQSCVPRARRLLQLLREFDALLNETGRGDEAQPPA